MIPGVMPQLHGRFYCHSNVFYSIVNLASSTCGTTVTTDGSTLMQIVYIQAKPKELKNRKARYKARCVFLKVTLISLNQDSSSRTHALLKKASSLGYVCMSDNNFLLGVLALYLRCYFCRTGIFTSLFFQ